MPVLAVNNQNPHEQAADCRSRPRWSAGKKTEVVLRLLGGEPLEMLSRELQVEAHRLAAWRDDFRASGKEGLKGQRPDRSADDRALRQAEPKVGQLTMENEILRAAASPSRSACDRCRSGGAMVVRAGCALRVPVASATGGPSRSTTVGRTST